MRDQPLEYRVNLVKKRVFDIIVSWLVIVFILTWLTPIIALLIIIESKGPIFFKQSRTGKDGAIFFLPEIPYDAC